MNASGQLEIGICGCGGRIQGLLKRMQPLLGGLNVAVTSLHDPSEVSLQRTQALFPEARIYHAYEAMLDNPSLDWVMIGSWNLCRVVPKHTV